MVTVYRRLLYICYITTSVVGYRISSEEKHPTHPRESTLAMVHICPTCMCDKYIGNGYENPSEMET